MTGNLNVFGLGTRITSVSNSKPKLSCWLVNIQSYKQMCLFFLHEAQCELLSVASFTKDFGKKWTGPVYFQPLWGLVDKVNILSWNLKLNPHSDKSNDDAMWAVEAERIIPVADFATAHGAHRSSSPNRFHVFSFFIGSKIGLNGMFDLKCFHRHLNSSVFTESLHWADEMQQKGLGFQAEQQVGGKTGGNFSSAT